MDGSQSHKKMNVISHPTHSMSNPIHLTDHISEICV
ncbi:hypothetical protein BH11VER1_BH11VER1_15120 [soil metagenome]